MNMHPTFVSKEPVGIGSIGEAPTSGDIIYVDFGDRVNFTQPIYMGKVSEGDIRAAGTGRAKELFGNATFHGEEWTMEAYTPNPDFKSTDPKEPCYKDPASGKTNNGRQCYIDVLAEVDPRRAKYQPRMRTTENNFSDRKETFCNWYIHDVMLALGLKPGKHWLRGTTYDSVGPVPGMNARNIWHWLKGQREDYKSDPTAPTPSAKSMGWVVTENWKKAQEQAQKGNPVIAGWDDHPSKRPDGREVLQGHVAMLRPFEESVVPFENMTKEMMMGADAGGNNKLKITFDRHTTWRWKLYAYYPLVDKKLKE